MFLGKLEPFAASAASRGGGRSGWCLVEVSSQRSRNTCSLNKTEWKVFFWPLRSRLSSLARIWDKTFEKNAPVYPPVVPVQHRWGSGKGGRSGRHSEQLYTKVLSKKILKLGEELCDNRNAKDNLVLFREQGFRGSKTRVLQ